MGRARAQHLVGARRPEAADHVDEFVRTAFAVGFPDEVEQTRVHLGRLVLAPVAQDTVQLFQTVRIELAIALVSDDGLFAGMDVIDLQAAGFTAGLRGRADEYGGRNSQSKEANGCNLGHLAK
ncbi:hypothetical protein RHSP_26902 [Rhizobium freirei PRF 81]|uniref:Uncharacterized protein n=1 Tax=Rhizobium freirei PRF 81 TaxID=363754 RepID=N6V0E1_9HYPH|nr:hypothetical protein RHSP_26902 [Rhizobium freirei PRF 81]